MGKFSLNTIIDKMYRKTVILKPLANGTFEVIDVTGESDEVLLKTSKLTVELKPKYIYKINGLKRIANFGIREFNGTQLVNLFEHEQEPMTEPTLMNLLENAENAGRLQAEGGGADEDKMRKQIQLMFIISILTLFGIVALIYMKGANI